MSPTGHNLTGVIVGLAGGHVALATHDALTAALWAAGAMLGARAPDWMELFKWVAGRRLSLILHRTLTHWPPLWIALSVLAWRFLEGDALVVATAALVTAWLHLLLDFATPSGIPLLHPFGRRSSARLYQSGDVLKEATALAVVSGITAMIAGTLLHKVCY